MKKVSRTIGNLIVVIVVNVYICILFQARRGLDRDSVRANIGESSLRQAKLHLLDERSSAQVKRSIARGGLVKFSRRS